MQALDRAAARAAASLPLGPQRRHISLRFASEQKDKSPLDTEKRTLELSFSSELPVERWFGKEILSHADGAADLSRLNDGAPLLFNHDWDAIIGVVEKAEVRDGRGYATVRFAKTPEGDKFMGMVADGIVKNVSFLYDVRKYVADVEDPDGDGDSDVYTATDWEAYEISLVSVPADPTVGVGRAEAGEKRDVPVERRLKPAAAAAPKIQEKTSMEPTGGAATVNLADELKKERERIAGIEALCKRHGMSDEVRNKLVNDGVTIELARGLVLNELEKKGATKPLEASPSETVIVDMTVREQARWSMIRAINAALSRNWEKAGFEREVSQAIAKAAGRQPQNEHSFFVPMRLPFAPTEEHKRAYLRALSERAPYLVGTAAQGGNLVATQLLAGDFIEVLRNASVTAQLGARILSGLVGNVDIPRQITQTATYWVGESAAPTEAEGTFDKVSLRPKTIAALSKMSRLMLLQATPDIEMIAREDLIAVGALGLDLGAISGSGSANQPTGIVNQSGVGSVVGGANGANFTFDHLVSLYTAPMVANAPMQNLGFAMNAKTRGYLATLKSTTGAYLWTPNGGGVGSPVADTVQGYPYRVSNQLRATLTKGTSAGICSELVFGNWRELLIGEWGVAEIMANPYDATGFTTGDVLIRMFQTVDIGVRHGASFAVMSDGLTPGF